MKVVKFGGSSMADAGQYRKIRDILLADPDRKIVIVSAAGKRYSGDHKLTDLLYLCYSHVKYGVDCSRIFKMISGRYLDIQVALDLDLDLQPELEALKKRVRLFVRLETLEYLKRGGRISKTSAVVGGILHIKPILTLNGEGTLETVGKARGIRQSHQMMNDSILACGGIDFSMPVVMTYAGDINDGSVQKYWDDSEAVFEGHTDLVTVGQLGCVIGTHTGPGAIVIAFVPKSE